MHIVRRRKGGDLEPETNRFTGLPTMYLFLLMRREGRLPAKKDKVIKP